MTGTVLSLVSSMLTAIMVDHHHMDDIRIYTTTLIPLLSSISKCLLNIILTSMEIYVCRGYSEHFTNFISLNSQITVETVEASRDADSVVFLIWCWLYRCVQLMTLHQAIFLLYVQFFLYIPYFDGEFFKNFNHMR